MGTIFIILNGQKHAFLPLIIGCCCDLPAKNDVQGMVGYSGYFGCGFCNHPGIPVKGEKIIKVRYIKGTNDYEERTHKHFIDAYGELNSKPIKGIKSISCLIAADKFNLSAGFAIDVMHCVHLGVVKRLLYLWLEPKNKCSSFFMNKKQQTLLSSKIVCLKPVSDIIRGPRSIFKKGDFKANEYRSLLLYYLPIALEGCLENQFVRHFRLLSTATYILSKEVVKIDEIEKAQKLLDEFCNSFEKLYGLSNVTMNVHLLRHLPMAVQNLGPLWCQSAYAFEAKNGMIMRQNTTTTPHMVQQLAWKYVTQETIKYDVEEERKNELELKAKSTVRVGETEKNYSTKWECT